MNTYRFHFTHGTVLDHEAAHIREAMDYVVDELCKDPATIWKVELLDA